MLVPAEEAYGTRDEQLVIKVPRDRFQGIDDIQIGMQFEAETQEGNRLVTIVEVGDAEIAIDANHPLAGMDLDFSVKIVIIRTASAEELEHGHPHVDDHGCGGDCGCNGDCGDDCDCH